MLKIDYLSKQGNIKIITKSKSGIILYPSRIRILAMVNKKVLFQEKKTQFWNKWHFVANKTKITQHILKMH